MKIVEHKIEKWGKYSRAAIPFLAEQGLKNMVGAEIGVYRGSHAGEVLTLLDIKKFYLIDPYEKYPGYRHVSSRNIPQAKTFALNKLKSFEDKIEWIYKKSDDAVKDITEPLDWVYIDGNHSLDFAYRDMVNYYPLIKPGGYLTGDDYCVCYKTEDDEGKLAVDKFVEENGYILNIATHGNKTPEWWIQKL